MSRPIVIIALAALTPLALLASEPPALAKETAAELFATAGCGWCHEQGGRVAGKGPKLAGTTRSDAFIVDRIKNGKEGSMPSFEGTLTNAQIKSLVRYIRSLK